MDIRTVLSIRPRIVLVDAALVLLVVVVAQLDAWSPLLATGRRGPGWLAFLALTGVGLLLVLRRHRPFAMTVIMCVVVPAWWFVEGTATTASAVTLALLAAAYSLGRWDPDRRRSVAGAGLIGVVLVLHLVGQPDLTPEMVRGELPWELAYLGAWLLGAYLRYRSLYVHQLREAAAQAERVRIARELHDVVAHGVSVMVIQAEAAEELLSQHDNLQASSSLRSVQETGRQTLRELRTTLGALRAATGAERAPGPRLAHLEELAEQVRAAGVDVSVRIQGEVRALSPAVNLVAYRVVQEALTNILKHSTAITARVALTYREEDLALEVLDEGPARAPTVTSTGAGLVGMQERVASVGGRLDAGAGADGGYAVRAWLPTVEPA